jgi:ATP-dependent DNA helicase RecG
MPIPVEQIDNQQLDLILSLQEGHFVDLKSVDIKPSKLSESVSALANSDGGELFIGIDEDKKIEVRTWRGFFNQEAANAHLQVFEESFPLGQDFQYTFLECSGAFGLLLQVQIQKTRDIRACYAL